MDIKRPVQTLETAVVIYVYQEQELPKEEVIRKAFQQGDLVLFIYDGSLKKVRDRVAKLTEEEFPRDRKRAELIHHDNLYVDLTKNSHAAHYQLMDPKQLSFMVQHMHIKHRQLPLIQANDPLLLYYGFPEDTIVTQTYESALVAGQKIDYMFVIPETSNTIYFGHII